MAKFMTILYLFLTSSMAASIPVVHAERNPPGIFVFGDSLSDVGNNNNMLDAFKANFPHYGVDFPGHRPTGRFTNGYNFIDMIAQLVGFSISPQAYASIGRAMEVLRGVNFASGGSGIAVKCVVDNVIKCITMEEQILNFRRTRVLLQPLLHNRVTHFISKSIFIITCGSNDLNGFFNDNFLNPTPPIDEYVSNLTSKFRDQLQELYNLGGRKFLIINVPAIGMIPTARALEPLKSLGLDFPKLLNGYAQMFNAAEETMLKELSSALPEMKYSIGNSYRAVLDVIEHPEEHGIKNVTSPCCGEVRFVTAVPPVEVIHCAPDAWLCSNRSEFVFWDNIHPTQGVIDYASNLFYSGGRDYAEPINVKQLVEMGSSGWGVPGNRGGVEAM